MFKSIFLPKSAVRVRRFLFSGGVNPGIMLVLLCFLTTLSLPAAHPPDKPLSIHVVPCKKAGGEVVIMFSQPMVKEINLHTSRYPQVTFTPMQKGSFKWRSPEELVFTPADGFMGGGQYISIAVEKAVPLTGEQNALPQSYSENFFVPYFQAAGKVANWPIVKDQPRFIGLLNWYSGQVGSGPLFLLYDQPVSPGKFKGRITVRDAKNKPLKSRVYRPERIDQVTGDKVDIRHLIALQILDLPEKGSSVIVAIPGWQNGTFHSSEQILTVNTTFNLTNRSFNSKRKGGYVPLKFTCYLDFNNPFELTMFKEALCIAPAAKSLEVTGAGWQRVRVQAELEPGTRYRLTLDDTFTDVLGNSLSPKVDARFDSRDLPPILNVLAAPVLLERQGTRLPVKIRNARFVEARIFRFNSPQAFSRALSSGRKKSAREYGIIEAGSRMRQSEVKIPANRAGMFDLRLDGKPGLMCVEVVARGTGSEADGMMSDAVLVQCTDLGITAKVFEKKVFAWVTRLHDAAPVSGAEVELYDGDRVASRGKTDKFGVLYLEAAGFASGSGLDRPMVIVAKKGDDVAVSQIIDNHLAQPWQFGLKGKVRGSGKLHAALFSERGVYRPGETVHLKAIVGGPQYPGENSVELHVQDPRGQKVVSQNLSLDVFGSIDFDVALKEQAPVGVYSVQISRGTDTASYRFRVEEYRVPTFKVAVGSEQVDWQYGKESNAVIRADYLHGGSLGGREVRWEVLRRPQAFAPPAFPKFIFTSGDVANLTGSVTSGQTQLDGQGTLPVNFRPDHPASAGPMRYIVEAAVTDVDRQTYAGRLSRVVHPAAFYIGVIPPPRCVHTAGEILQVPIVAVRPDGTPVEKVKIKVQLERIDHHTAARLGAGSAVQLLNRPVSVKELQCDVISKKTAVNCSFKLPRAGLYRVRALARDKRSHSLETGFTITVSGDNPTAWPRFDQDRIEITADKQVYKTGETARLVVQSPYKNARGLMTIERDNIIDYQVFKIKGDTPTLSVPIKAAFAPNVYVSVILLRGRVHRKKDASGYETGAPGFKIGCIPLKVDPVEKRLTLHVTPNQKKANPGQELKIDLKISDHRGLPTSGQATVMVVDEAVLGLTGYNTPDPVSRIYSERPLGVRTGSSRLDLPHARRARLEKIFPGGDGANKISFLDFPLELRNLFKSTAYWNPTVPIGEDGRASIAFELPDNLTTYRIMAVVTDRNSRVGSADQQVQVRKPLMIQPVLPRFLYPKDRLQIEALVFNGTDTPGKITLKSRFYGLELTGGTASQQAVVKAGESKSFKFAVKVSGKKEAVIGFAANIEGHSSDGVEVKLPILEPGSQRTIVVGKSMPASGTIPVTLPAKRVPGSVKMEVVTSTTVLSELKDSVQYLMRYPNGCIEQTTSTAYPLVVLKDLLPEIGIEVNQADLKKFSEAGVRRILSFQTPSGGLSYWPGSPKPHAFATAFGLTALIEAKKRGYDVPDKALDGMADYLEAALRKGQISGEMPHGGMADGDTRALFVMTLGRLGRPQPGYVSVLWRQRENLTPFGLSFLAIAVKEMPGDQSLLEPILAEIRTAAQEDEKEAYYNSKRKGGWSFDSPLRTHGSALVAFAEAGAPGDMSGKLLTGLLKRRRYGLWGNTQENVFGIMGVHAIAGRVTGGEKPKMELKINNRQINETEMEAVSQRVRRLSLTEPDLTLQIGKEETINVSLNNNGGAPIYLTVRVQYEVPLDEKNCKPQSHGFEISRHYESMKGESLDGKPIPLGSLVRVRVKVKTNSDHHYVAIDDKLPAGLEPLNTGLKTTQRVGQGEFTADMQRSFSVLSYKEIRDARVAFYVDEMLPGNYEYTYVARATTPGIFLRTAGRVEAMYQPEICGTTSIDKVIIESSLQKNK
ncbi:alpha-2-macroglobulin [Acidobacteriota bacterium]